MRIFIKRTSVNSNSITGELYVDDNFVCYTLEHLYRDNQRSVSSIPEGTYGGKLRYDHSDKWRVELTGTQPRTHIQIHIGNTPAHTKGCILVGMKALPKQNKLEDSKKAYNALKKAFYGTETPTQTPDGEIQVVITSSSYVVSNPEQEQLNRKLEQINREILELERSHEQQAKLHEARGRKLLADFEENQEGFDEYNKVLEGYNKRRTAYNTKAELHDKRRLQYIEFAKDLGQKAKVAKDLTYASHQANDAYMYSGVSWFDPQAISYVNDLNQKMLAAQGDIRARDKLLDEYTAKFLQERAALEQEVRLLNEESTKLTQWESTLTQNYNRILGEGPKYQNDAKALGLRMEQEMNEKIRQRNEIKEKLTVSISIDPQGTQALEFSTRRHLLSIVDPEQSPSQTSSAAATTEPLLQLGYFVKKLSQTKTPASMLFDQYYTYIDNIILAAKSYIIQVVHDCPSYFPPHSPDYWKNGGSHTPFWSKPLANIPNDTAPLLTSTPTVPVLGR